MYTAAINLSMTDVLGLVVMAIVLGIVTYMVLNTRRKLQKLMRESEAQISCSGAGRHYPQLDEPEILRPPAFKAPAKKTAAPVEEEGWAVTLPFIKKAQKAEPAYTAPDSELFSLKNNIEQQQRSLQQLLQQVDEWKGGAAQARNHDVVEELQALLDEKDAELHNVKQQLAASQKMAVRIDDVYREFEELQLKISGLEKQAKGASELAIELDDMREAQKQVKKELLRKHEKLQEAVDENQRLHRQLNETEDKLAEANFQRVQLQKKVQYLENLHTEFQQVAEANKKLQNELRRIGELESMLSMVSDERDILLKRRQS
ncbi:MAG: hypothetical protein ACO1NX_11025 [Chitinophagaceae bacterium]